MSSQGPVIVLGAGVMGMGVAWRLARAGVPCAVYEASTSGSGASRAAAGMLAPHAELEFHEHALFALGLESQRRWATFAAELQRDSDVDVELDTTGTLLVAVDRDQAEELERHQQHMLSAGLDVRWLSGRELRRVEPMISPRAVGAVHCPQDHQVSNRQTAAALRAALQRAGVPVHEGRRAVRVETAGGVVSGVAFEDGSVVAACQVVIATGAWSRQIDGLGALCPPVRPVKGQMLALTMDARLPLLRHVVRTPEVYLVPKRDGTLVVGATSEEQGFDDRLTAGGVFELLRSAWETVPGIYELPVREMWTGFRPGSRDNGPILGPSPIPGLHFITGHYRNGIQQLPLSVTAVAATLLGEPLPSVCQPFTIHRFLPDAGGGDGTPSAGSGATSGSDASVAATATIAGGPSASSAAARAGASVAVTAMIAGGPSASRAAARSGASVAATATIAGGPPPSRAAARSGASIAVTAMIAGGPSASRAAARPGASVAATAMIASSSSGAASPAPAATPTLTEPTPTAASAAPEPPSGGHR